MKRPRGIRLVALVSLAACLILLARVVAHANASGADQQPGQGSTSSPAGTQSERITEHTQRRGSRLLILQTQEEADAKTSGCMSSGCHHPIDSTTMHAPGTVRLGCTDCHGGDASVTNTAAKDTAQYEDSKKQGTRPRALSRRRAFRWQCGTFLFWSALAQGKCGVGEVRKSRRQSGFTGDMRSQRVPL